MSTFDYLTPAEAVAAAQSSAPGYQRITGLRGLIADRMPNLITRPKAGAARKPEGGEGQRAHAHLDKFKTIARVEWAKDADPGTAEVFYADGSTDLAHRGDLLCVERPIITAESPRADIEANKAKIKDETLPIEERRAAFRAHNRYQTEASTPTAVAYDVPDVEPDPETGLSTWSYLANGKLIGRVEETERGYVPVRTDSLGTETWRDGEKPSRDQALDAIREHFEKMNGHAS
ncbi:hypothetical protein ABZS76_32825 [Streptomyces sp. NPDC005562]|uniref:hypothetical protein n=1 Tax=Streptomyces sp. NPDC005562 TaxID=3154890 RepID=UPI0033AD6773